jgi:hypothetical protein
VKGGGHTAGGDLGLASLHVLDVLTEARLVALHCHRGDAGLGQLRPVLRARVPLEELKDLAERHQRLATEPAEGAVGVVLLRQGGVVGVRVMWEEAAC